MAILDKLLGVTGAVRDKVKQTFGDPQAALEGRFEGRFEDGAAASEAGLFGPALDVPGAFSALGLSEGATLAAVREACRVQSRTIHPIARRDGFDSEAARALDRLLEALELLEEHLVPLTPSPDRRGGGSGGEAPPASRRKRATPRAR
jgi:hypothetical protein